VKILYVSQYFPPEMGAPAARAAELALHWAQAGHQVSVLTGFPNHPTGVVPDEWRPRLRRLAYRENVNGVDVFRTWLWPLPNRKAHERMRNYASFCVSAALRGLTLPRPDVVIATSPQLLVGLAGWWLAFARQIPFVFEVRDLWPESLAAVGVGDEDSLLHHALGALAGFLYERSDRIVVVTSAFKEILVQRQRVPVEKIAIVENGVETDLFAPLPQSANNELRQKLGFADKFLVCYAGTMGMAHGLETLLDAASQLQRDNPKVQFLLVGEGAEKDRIKTLAPLSRVPCPAASCHHGDHRFRRNSGGDYVSRRPLPHRARKHGAADHRHPWNQPTGGTELGAAARGSGGDRRERFSRKGRGKSGHEACAALGRTRGRAHRAGHHAKLDALMEGLKASGAILQHSAGVGVDFAVQADFFKRRCCPFHDFPQYVQAGVPRTLGDDTPPASGNQYRPGCS